MKIIALYLLKDTLYSTGTRETTVKLERKKTGEVIGFGYIRYEELN